MIVFVLGYPLATLLYVKTVVIPDLDEKAKLRQRFGLYSHGLYSYGHN